MRFKKKKKFIEFNQMASQPILLHVHIISLRGRGWRSARPCARAAREETVNVTDNTLMGLLS